MIQLLKLTLEVPRGSFLTHEGLSMALRPLLIIAGPNNPVTFNHLWGCTTHKNFIPLEVWKIYVL